MAPADPFALPRQNAPQAERDWPPAVVGGVFQTGLNLMRDLSRKGVRAHGIDHDSTHQGFRSVYGKSYACPNPDTHPEEWVQFMKRLSEKLGAKPVFIPAADIYIAALGRHAEELHTHYIVAPEAARLQAALSTKETQYALAARFGFPCPRLAYITSRADLLGFMEGARFPCLIEPRSPREWSDLPTDHPLRRAKVMIAETPEALLAHYALAEPFRPEAIAQEVIPGLGSAKSVYLSVYGDSARLLGNCVVREVRDYPPFTGMPSVVQPVRDPEVTSLCDGFLRQLSYRGICEFEVKRDARDGQVRLIEINPRFSGTGDAASYTGVETGWLHYLDMIGQAVAPVQPQHFDFHHISFDLESNDSVYHWLRGDLRWREMLAPYQGKVKFYDLDFHDRALALTQIKRAARNAGGHLIRHWKQAPR